MAPDAIADLKRIVILGGSYSGVSIAHYVLKHTVTVLPDPETYQVVLISSSSEAMCRPACPRAMISESMFDQSKLFINIEEQFKQYAEKFSFVHGTVSNLDTFERSVSVSYNGEIEVITYYALVIATGATANSPLHGFHGDSSKLKNHWVHFREALTKARTVIVAGGGPTGVETAGELGEYLNGWNSGSPKVDITLITSNRILPYLRPELAHQAESYLLQVGVNIIKDVKVQSTVPESAGMSEEHLTVPTAVTLSDGRSLSADIFIPAYGTTPNTNFAPNAILAEDGRIKTNSKTLRVDEAGPLVYAIGDVCDAARPAIHTILSQVPVLGANIKRDLLLDSIKAASAQKDDTSFREDLRESQLVPIGTKKGVGAMMGYKLPSFLVWLVKGRDYWLWTTGRLWSGKQWA